MKPNSPGRLLLPLLTAFLTSWGPAARLLAAPAAWATPIDLQPLDAPKLKSLVASGAHATIFNLWASWCAPCKKEMPELLEFVAKRKADNVRLVLVSGDSADDKPAAVSFLSKFTLDFPVYNLAGDPEVFMKSFDAGWPGIVPTTMLFDEHGKRVGYWLGELKFKDLEAALAKLKKPETIKKH